MVASKMDDMIELGYLAKRISRRPDWLDVPGVTDLFSVCNCMSSDFCDYIDAWRHNGFWLFDNPGEIRNVASDLGVELESTTLVFLQSCEKQFDAVTRQWTRFYPELGLPVKIQPPVRMELVGYDVVTFSMQNSPEHSPLSCNHVASEVPVNEHCLFDSRETAIECLEAGVFDEAEPGPFRIIAVNMVDWDHV